MKANNINNIWNMKIGFAMLLAILTSYINVYGQSVVDDIIKEYQVKKEHDKRILDIFRNKDDSIYLYCGGYTTVNDYYYVEDSVYQKLQGKGIVPDSAMQTRILQLLKNEFYDGELEMLVNDELKSDEYIGLPDSVLYMNKAELAETFRSGLPRYKLRSLIEACVLVENEQITKRIEEMYNDPQYDEFKRDLIKCLLLSHAEPYTSKFLKQSKYKKTLSGDEQMDNINKLEYIYTQESIREIAEYLFSEAYWIDTIIDDAVMPSVHIDVPDIITDSIDNSLAADTTFDGYEYVDIDWDDEIVGSDYVEIRYNYYYGYAYSIIKIAISNPDLYETLGVGPDERLTDDFLTLERRRKIYQWMKKNYGKYKLRKRWK